MQYLICDPKAVRNKYFLGGDKGCFNSGWGPTIEEVLSRGVSFHRDEPRKETTLKWVQHVNETSVRLEILIQAESITLEYVQQHHPELLI